MVFWPFGRTYKVRSLNRDARYIVEDAHARFPPERMRELAAVVKSHIDEAHAQLADPKIGAANVLTQVKALHREARRRSHDTMLSALTLVIIYIEAEELGADCAPAIEAVDELLASWVEDTGDGAPCPALRRRDGTFKA